MKHKSVKRNIRDHLHPFLATWRLIRHDGQAEIDVKILVQAPVRNSSRAINWVHFNTYEEVVGSLIGAWD